MNTNKILLKILTIIADIVQKQIVEFMDSEQGRETIKKFTRHMVEQIVSLVIKEKNTVEN
ncbi:TPA: hypothetical protein QFK10_002386 [Enterococcus faecium]|uniref:hypothetical protein n=1 Tax=Enterococcus TaxID=1350 RepID=UPI00069EED32|nr:MULTISPECIES: hypothetical protein [Enterococcus]AKX85926.1 hypothetical protein LIANG_06815 [Enterococcus durans]AKZ47306.1 hypothetical protein LIU_01740 [Enterococcus durans]MBE9884646.1 hypothetical protein [Enterococcus faecium]MCU1961793.1 hypothetical protein [Enterococcus faecium]MDK4459938.1 hypothetical protein [Enterococcus faecium]